jgi:hypothetical protein
MIIRVYVKHTPSGFQWGLTPGTLAPLEKPIATPSQTPVTYELLQLGPKGIFYRLQNGSSGKLRPVDGPSQEVPPEGSRTCTFSTSSSGDYLPGIVQVVPFANR